MKRAASPHARSAAPRPRNASPRSPLALARLAAASTALALLAPAPAARAVSPAPDPLVELVDAENAFAGYTVEHGVRDGFVAWFAEDSILFRPHPVPGKQFMEDRPARPGILSWYPEFAEVSSAGDLGFTYGPWEFRPKSRDDKPVGFGHFISVWQLQADGRWKVVFDHGINHPAPPAPIPPAAPVPKRGPKLPAKDRSAEARGELGSAETAFARALGQEGTINAYTGWLADDARLFRQDHLPAVGKVAALEMLPKPGTPVQAVMVGARASASGDLGFTYGTWMEASSSADRPAVHGVYSRIWRKAPDGRWKIVSDVSTPAPPANGWTLYKDANWHVQQATKAHAAKEWPKMLEHMLEALAMRPTQPTFLYNLAAAQALNGDGPGAVRTLTRVAAMGLSFPATQDADFAALKEDEGFKAAVAKLEANLKPIGNAQPAGTLPGKGIIAEGLAFDPDDGSFFVGSVRQRKILKATDRLAKNGRVQDFSSPADGLWAVFGMKVDPKRRHLWVASSAVPEMEGWKAEDKGQAGLFQYDLKTGKLLRRLLVPRDGADHVLGDLELSPEGDVYASDSATPAVYVLRAGKERLEKLVEGGPLVSLQGLALAPGGRTLYVADYTRGIFRLDLGAPTPLLLVHPDDVTLLGIDGLYLHDGGLVAVQNGVHPARVVRLELNDRGSAVTKATVLSANHPAHHDPTLGVIVDGALYYIANGQWDLFGGPGQANPEKLKETVILSVGL